MSNWCMGCGREIPDGDLCGVCMLNAEALKRGDDWFWMEEPPIAEDLELDETFPF